MKRTIRILALVASLAVFTVSQAMAYGLNNCTVNNAGSNSAGQTWINVTSGGSTYNFLFPTASANTFLATALTALSSGKMVNLDVVSLDQFAGVNAMVVAN